MEDDMTEETALSSAKTPKLKSKGCCFVLCCHDEDKDVHPKYNQYRTEQIEDSLNSSSLRDFLSCLTCGLIENRNEQTVTYDGQKMSRWRAQVRWNFEKKEEKYKNEKGKIKYDPEIYIEPKYDDYTLEELREMEMNGNYLIRTLDSRTLNELEMAQKTYRNKMISIYGEDKIKKEDAAKAAIAKRKQEEREKEKRKKEEEEKREQQRKEDERIKSIEIGYSIGRYDPPHIVAYKKKSRPYGLVYYDENNPFK